MRSETVARVSGVLALALLILPGRLQAACDPGCGSADPCVVSSPITVDNGCTIDIGTRELRIISGGALAVGIDTVAMKGGTMTLNAGTLTVQMGGVVSALGSTTASGGTLTANVGAAAIAGTIDASGAPGGNITVTASGNLSVTGSVTARAATSSDNGGQVQLTAGTATVSGLVSVLGGPIDGVGGDLFVDASGDVTVSGTLNSQGGEGGTGEVSTRAGNVMITNTAMLIADATEGGGLGGEFDVTAAGDGTTTGLATINGLLSVKGFAGTADTGGGDGGCICIDAAGDIHTDLASALMTADGGIPDGDAGEIDITSDNASLTMQGTLSAAVGGTDSGGGTVSIETATDATVNGPILLTGGSTGGGEADVSSDSASVTIGAASVINVSSNLMAAGDGGIITLTSGADSAAPHAVMVAGKLMADGGPGGGAGGSIDLEGGDSVHVASTSSLHASGGGTGSGAGGTLMANADPTIVSSIVAIEGPLTAEGGSPSGHGGVITVGAGGQISFSAALDAKGFGAGGMVGIGSADTTGPVEAFGNITVASSTAAGGSIEIKDEGDIAIAGTLVADGTVAPATMPSIEIVGCNVTLCGMDAPSCPAGSTGVLSSLGPSGVNQVTGRSSTAILGTMRADKNTGSNILIYHGSPQNPPLVLGSVTPAQTVNADASIVPCPVCGDHIVESPETCDDGNTLDGDGCSSMCQIEVGLPGDVNGDHAVTVDDLGYLVTEIFDGDGDSVSMVSGGSFPGRAGADANGDSVITAADVTSVVKILLPAP